MFRGTDQLTSTEDIGNIRIDGADVPIRKKCWNWDGFSDEICDFMCLVSQYEKNPKLGVDLAKIYSQF